MPEQSQNQNQAGASPAFVKSSSEQESAVEKAPWQTDEFKAKVAAAGFPGSPQTDESWLIALYKFSGGTMPAPKPAEAPKVAEAPKPTEAPQNPS
jgi:hypothetical protein